MQNRLHALTRRCEKILSVRIVCSTLGGWSSSGCSLCTVTGHACIPIAVVCVRRVPDCQLAGMTEIWQMLQIVTFAEDSDGRASTHSGDHHVEPFHIQVWREGSVLDAQIVVVQRLSLNLEVSVCEG